MQPRDPGDAQMCPWCGTWALKDDACNWVCCGLAVEGFVVGAGCGRQYCFQCGGRLCGQLYDPATGAVMPGVPTNHTEACCPANGPPPAGNCPGGHNSHR
jgi:hypothetical protein